MLQVKISAENGHEIQGEVVEFLAEVVHEREMLGRVAAESVMRVYGSKKRSILAVTKLHLQLLPDSGVYELSKRRRREDMNALPTPKSSARDLQRST